MEVLTALDGILAAREGSDREKSIGRQTFQL